MPFSKEILKGSVDVIILRTLDAHGEAYGYQLVRLIETHSGHVFSFREGTLYPLLYRLEERGYISSRRKQAENGKTRRYYAITKDGRTYLRSKTAEWKTFTKGLLNVLRSGV